MAKKVNSLAKDFAGINESADSRVLAMLTETNKQTVGPKITREKEATPPRAKAEQQTTQAREKTTSKGKLPKSRQVQNWGKPIAHFNTRIPEQMSELLDDLIYKLRKKGIPRSKQQLAHEAIEDLLRKHTLI